MCAFATVAEGIGEAWILARDEAELRAAPGPVAPARLLPSGDAYFLLQGGGSRTSDPRRRLPSPAVDSSRLAGALLVDGEIVGTWRRAQQRIAIQVWRRLSGAARDAIETEAAALPLSGIQGKIVVRWDD